MGLFANPNPSAFVRALPKAELHLHLEGAIEPTTLLEIQQNHGQSSATLADVQKLYHYSDFGGFLVSFKDITAHLKEPADYEIDRMSKPILFRVVRLEDQRGQRRAERQRVKRRQQRGK